MQEPSNGEHGVQDVDDEWGDGDDKGGDGDDEQRVRGDEQRVGGDEQRQGGGAVAAVDRHVVARRILCSNSSLSNYSTSCSALHSQYRRVL